MIPFFGIVTSIIAAGMFNAAVGIGACLDETALEPCLWPEFPWAVAGMQHLAALSAGTTRSAWPSDFVAFAAYCTRFRFSDTAGLIVRVAIVAALAFVPMVLFTAVRGEDRGERSGTQFLFTFASVSPSQFAEAGQELERSNGSIQLPVVD